MFAVRLIIVVGLSTASASAQFVHLRSYPFSGDSPGDQFGWAVGAAGDVNNDGFDDFIVGTRFDDNLLANSGSVRVISGRDGAYLYTRNGDSAGDELGFSASGAGDVNNDGFEDFIGGAWQDDNNGADSGSARVYSGATGNILYTFNGDSVGDLFGYSVSGAGDVNSDGFDDLIVGAILDDNNGSNSGSARVFSGANGAILYTFNGDGAGDQFGVSVSGAGDVNNDGFDDVVVGAHTDDNNGSDSGIVRVFSGATGAILYTFNGDGDGDQMGGKVSDAGDVNNDGFDDIIAGARLDDNNGADSGSARVFSGASGAILYTFNGDSAGDVFGQSVSTAGDLDNDGFDEVIVGASLSDGNGTDSGSARVFSGATGAILYTFHGNFAFARAGIAVAGGGDLNNDGVPDLIVGAFLDDTNGADSGSAGVFLSVDVSCPSPPAPCIGDADANRTVNFADITSVLGNFNNVCP